MQTNKEQKGPLRVVVAGANGQLGQRILAHLLTLQVEPIALVRSDRAAANLPAGVEVQTVDYGHQTQLVDVCRGAHCVVSALSGLENVLIDVQTALLNAAIQAGVPKFIPSDYCIDYNRLPVGSNRNLDIRRQFKHHLDSASIQATSILNGMFTDLLLGEAPLVQSGWGRVLYWGDADQPLDFTTLDDTAAYTARAAADGETPRFLCIAGDTLSSRELQTAASRALGKNLKLTRIGSLGLLKGVIAVAKTLAPQKGEVFPAWQGMQYMHNMYTGLPKLSPLDNDRYPGMTWTSVEETLRRGKSQS